MSWEGTMLATNLKNSTQEKKSSFLDYSWTVQVFVS